MRLFAANENSGATGIRHPTGNTKQYGNFMRECGRLQQTKKRATRHRTKMRFAAPLISQSRN